MELARSTIRLGLLFAGILAIFFLAVDFKRPVMAEPTPDRKQPPAQAGTIDGAKKKGFEGVDFSYDVFGASPGQDPQEISKQVMKKGYS